MPYYLNNGELQKDERLFEVSDRVWQFGDGLFETIKVADSSIKLIECFKK